MSATATLTLTRRKVLSPTVALVIETSTNKFDLRRADLLRAEFAVMVELGFELNVPPTTVLLQFSRLMQVCACVCALSYLCLD
jgi:hypothetical protein